MGTRGDVERDERRQMCGYENEVDAFDGDPQPTGGWVPVADEPDGPKPQKPATKCMHRVPVPSVQRFRVCWETLVDGRCPVHGSNVR